MNDRPAPTRSESVLRVSRVVFPVTALGPGTRLGVWVQGCSIRCHGCLALDTWNPETGLEMTAPQLHDIWRDARAAGAEGLTISGGEPGDQPEALTLLLEGVREISGSAAEDILLYTGYEWEEFQRRMPRVSELADAVITGPFRAALPTTLVWRGSANQILHPLSELGELRYAPHIDSRPERPPMQRVVTDERVWMIGVPRTGDLPRLDRALRRSDVTVGQTSWRPARDDKDAQAPDRHRSHGVAPFGPAADPTEPE
ncbi:4Fe-4S single cluster domain-containing protein [Streptomyces phaeochromogenes]|uniref:4Fe-4S single cluster domain-containing protein n=1 Tax=Streptomyces phaeochromogenes TaxID=1923 RepID=UPI0033C83C23